MNGNGDKLKSWYEEMFQLEVAGSNVEAAIENGLKQTGLNKDEINVRVLGEGSPGLFGLEGDKPAKVIISPLYERKDSGC